MRPTHQNCVFISHSGRVGESNFIIKTVSPKSDMAINCMFASKRVHDHPDRLVGETSVFAASGNGGEGDLDGNGVAYS